MNYSDENIVSSLHPVASKADTISSSQLAHKFDKMNIQVPSRTFFPSTISSNNPVEESKQAMIEHMPLSTSPKQHLDWVKPSLPTVAKKQTVITANTLSQNSNAVTQRRLRRGMIRVIEDKLDRKISDEDAPLPKAKLAQALEQHLFKTAPSFREYSNTKTLDSRLRLVLASLLRRRLKKAQKVSRTDVLRQHLGEEGYRTLEQLVHEVKQLRLERLSRDCAKCKRDGTCSIRPGHNAFFSGEVPQPVRELFFNTSLVQSFDYAPTEKISELDWSCMIEETRTNIQRYNEWESESTRHFAAV